MQKFRQFWPLYLLYAAELVVYLLFCLAFVGIKFFVKSLDTATLSEGTGALLLHIILAAPVVFGFFSRRYFIKGLWIAYVWVELYLSSNSDWIWLAIPIGHAMIVTLVLLFTSSGRDYFVTASEPEHGPEQTDSDFRFQRSADGLLRMRREWNEANPPTNATYRMRLMQGYWIGAALVVWGSVLALPEIGSIGFVLVLVCFVLHRKTAGSSGIFFRRSSSTGKQR